MVHIERKCPSLKLCYLLMHAMETDGPSIVTNPCSPLVFLCGVVLPHWLKVAHSGNSIKRCCFLDNRIIQRVMCEITSSPGKNSLYAFINIVHQVACALQGGLPAADALSWSLHRGSLLAQSGMYENQLCKLD